MRVVVMAVVVATAGMADMVVTADMAIFMVALSVLAAGVGAIRIPTVPTTHTIPIAGGSACASGTTGTGATAASGAVGNVQTLEAGGGSLFPVSHVDKVSRDCGGRSHCRRYKMRSPLVSLTAFKVAV